MRRKFGCDSYFAILFYRSMNLIAALTITLAVSATAVHAQVGPVEAQSAADTIRIRKVGGGKQFYFRGVGPLKKQQLAKVLSANPQAFALYKRSGTPRTFGDIIGGAGGFLLGYPLGLAIAGGEPNWTMAIVGAGLIGASIPLTVSGNQLTRQAVQLYNSGITGAPVTYRKPELRFQVTGNGAGLALAF